MSRRKVRGAVAAIAFTLGGGLLVGCSHDSDVASKNLSKEADSFRVLRRVVLYNGITDKYIVSVEGFCALGNGDSSDRVTVICKLGKEKYIKDIFVKSDNTLVYSDQLDATNVSTSHYKVIFKPSVVLPDPELQ